MFGYVTLLDNFLSVSVSVLVQINSPINIIYDVHINKGVYMKFITCRHILGVGVCIIAPMAGRKNVLFTPYGVVKGVITRGGIVEAITDLL